MFMFMVCNVYVYVYDMQCIMFSFFKLQMVLRVGKTPSQISEIFDVLRME